MMNEAQKAPVVVIGIGEIGSVIARGFLRTGRSVVPVTRDMDLNEQAELTPAPEAVVVAVGEAALPAVLADMPEAWKGRLILIQNELLPDDWLSFNLSPTVISVWFEKKKGQDVKVVVPSPIYGQHAELLAKALAELDIPTEVLSDQDQLVFELLRKNYYILTSNIAGLKVGGTVSELWQNHQEFAEDVIADIHVIQKYLVRQTVEQKLDKEKLIKAMLIAFEGDPDHGCMGRSAPARLQRALGIAEEAGLDVPTLKELANV